MLPNRKDFQRTINSQQTDLLFLQTEELQVAITNYGARIVSLLTKDKLGSWTDVIVGFDTLQHYLETDEIYHGAIIGRYANRIANGKFSLNGQTYTLATNNGKNHLHGGPKGFHDTVWNIDRADNRTLVLSYVSKDGEEGYPGNLSMTVIYTLEDSTLHIQFQATTDKDTIINVTNHAYFNLNGQGSGSVEQHQLQLNASRFTPINETFIPTGILQLVKDTPFDFTVSKPIGQDINIKNEQLQYGLGYDHNFALNKEPNTLTLAAIAIGDQSGVILEVFTTEPGIQLYTGNFMKGNNLIKEGRRDEYRSAFCLETQHFPDSPNHTDFPTTILRAREVFESTTSFRFS